MCLVFCVCEHAIYFLSSLSHHCTHKIYSAMVSDDNRELFVKIERKLFLLFVCLFSFGFLHSHLSFCAFLIWPVSFSFLFRFENFLYIGFAVVRVCLFVCLPSFCRKKEFTLGKHWPPRFYKYKG